MHELSIAMSIIDIAQEVAEQQHGGSIVAVHLKLGPLAGVVKEALVSAFELAREGSVLAASSLVIEDVPIAGYCQTCGREQPIESMQNHCCSHCKAPMRDITRGAELEIAAMEFES